MFLTSKQTGGPLIFALRRHDHYLAVGLRISGDKCQAVMIHPFNIGQLAQRLGQGAGETRQEHTALILLACMGGKLFEWLNSGGE